MIKLMDGWEIDFDGDYIVRKNSGKTDKNGLPIYSSKSSLILYHTPVRSS